jgi:hypothetical protein
MGFTISQDESLKIIVAIKGKMTIELLLNDKSIIIDKKKIDTDTLCVFIDGVFMLSEKFIVEYLGEKIDVITDLNASIQWMKYVSVTISDIEVSKLDLIKNTDHFNIQYNTINSECIDDISKTIENEYKNICKQLNYDYNKKTLIKIYPNMQELLLDNDYYGDVAGVAIMERDEIIMVSPLASGFDYNNQTKVVVHEFIHKVEQNINNRMPAWLNEGIAYYFARQNDVIDDDGFIQNIENGIIPVFENHGDTLQSLFNIEYWIPYVYSVIDFIIKEYGYDKLNQFIRNPYPIEDIFGISDSEFWDEWKSFLQNNY